MTDSDTRPDPRGDGPDDPEERDALLAARLGELLDVGVDLGGRTAESVDRRLRARSTASLAGELLSVGWWTVAALLDDAPRGPRGGEPLTDRSEGADGDRGGR